MTERAATAAGAALLLMVVVVHFRYHDIAAWLYPQRAEYASRALFYVARGVSGAAVFAVLMMLAPPASIAVMGSRVAASHKPPAAAPAGTG